MTDVEYIINTGGVLTSSYHPEGDTYTLLSNGLHYSISPSYKLVDIFKSYPFDKIGRSWYKDIDTLKEIIDTGNILDYRFK